MEKWRKINGYEDAYEVSDLGRVRSIRRGGGIKSTFDAHGYRRVSLYRGAKSKAYFVHRLVLEAFVGPCPVGSQSCHSNGIRDDNRLDNLRWGTLKENCSDRFLHGTAIVGSKSPNAKLSESDVQKIFDLRSRGMSLEGIASITGGVSTSLISLILRGRAWKHVCVRRGRLPKKASNLLNEVDLERIADLRRSGCSQHEVAKWIGISRSYVALIDQGRRMVRL